VGVTLTRIYEAKKLGWKAMLEATLDGKTFMTQIDVRPPMGVGPKFSVELLSTPLCDENGRVVSIEYSEKSKENQQKRVVSTSEITGADMSKVLNGANVFFMDQFMPPFWQDLQKSDEYDVYWLMGEKLEKQKAYLQKRHENGILDCLIAGKSDIHITIDSNDGRVLEFSLELPIVGSLTAKLKQ
jgi:hypothetical protein